MALARLLGKPIKKLTEKVEDFGDEIGELEQTRELQKMADDKRIEKTQKIFNDFTKSVSTYGSDVKRYASIGFTNKETLNKFIAKRQKEMTDSYSKLKEAVSDAMTEITNNIDFLASEEGQKQMGALKVISEQMKQIAKEDKILNKKEKLDKHMAKVFGMGKTSESIFDKDFSSYNRAIKFACPAIRRICWN